MSDTDLDSINMLWRQCFHAFKRSSSHIYECLDLSKVDANILLALNNNTNIRKADLADYLSFTPASLTRSLERLANKALIQRIENPDDKRSITLALSRNGSKMVKELQKQMRDQWSLALKGFDKTAIKQLERTLDQMLANLRTPL